MSKYVKHAGIINFKVGEDEFSMRPNIKDFAILSKINNGDNSFNEEDIDTFIKIITNAILRVDTSANKDEVKSFVENNFIICTNALNKLVDDNKDMLDLVNKQKKLNEDKKVIQ